MAKLNDITGKRFGKLVVIERGANIGGKPGWVCQCDCGTIKTVRGAFLVNNLQVSCGCMRGIPATATARAERGKRISEAKTTHGMTGTPEHRAWHNMKNRCYNPDDLRAYKNHGGRGIKVCDRWLDSFENFLADVGEKPFPEATFERIDNDGDYTPKNCIWADRFHQNINRRPSLTSSTGIQGVRFRKERGKYQARIGVKGKVISLGLFQSIDDAISARLLAEKRYWGE